MGRLGSIAAVLGFFLLTAAALFSGSDALRQGPACPPIDQARPSAGPAAYLTSDRIRLDGLLCLAIDRSRFFAEERGDLQAASDAVAAAQAAVAAASATPAALPGAQAQLATAQAALAALPIEREVFIFFDEVKVPIESRGVAIRPAAGESEWTLQQIELLGTENAASDSGEAWRDILGGAKSGGTRAVRIGVAVAESADAPPVMRALIADRATLRVYDPVWVLAGALGLILLAAGILMRGWNTGLLRDGGPTSPFSLGHVQMAFWLVLSVGGFLFIWLVSGQWESVVTGGVIALLGISATTGVTARMVGENGAATSQGFWNDIVSDADGAALHRIQLIAWTIVLGAIFAWTVVWEFSFPDFDTNLLLLAGIAGGTYIGFKFQESGTAAAPAPPPQA